MKNFIILLLVAGVLGLAGCSADITTPVSAPTPAPEQTVTPEPETTAPVPVATPLPEPPPAPVVTATPPPAATVHPEPVPAETNAPEPETPRCPDGPLFTVSPLAIEDIADIVTLGNLNPPSHTFPTDHIYFYLPRQPGADRPDMADVYAPGDMTVTEVTASEHVNAGFADYSLVLQPCDAVRVVFGHVSSLDEGIFGDTTNFSDWRLMNEYETGGETYRLWSRQYRVEVKAGDRLGTAGGNRDQWALDLGVYDERVTAGNIAAPGRWQYRSDYFHVACPLAYYEPGPVLDALVSLVSRDPVPGEKIPCGTIHYDIPGTAQGLWFVAGTVELTNEDPHLALVYHNIRPASAVFSVGLSVPGLASGVYEFLPRDTGRLNRAFGDITPDGQVYGFQVAGYNGIIIVTMPDGETLYIQALPGATTNPATWVFTADKATFER